MPDHNIVYEPPPTLRKFHASKAFVRVIVGPVGSGKTTGMAMELAMRAAQERPSNRGIRATRFAVVRNTLQQLRQTVLPDINKWLGPAWDWRESRTVGYLRFGLPDGTKVDSEWLFIPLDTVQDTRRLLSNNFTGAWISELREVPYEIFFHIQARLGRFRPWGVPPVWEGLICETNPWSEGSDYHQHLILDNKHADGADSKTWKAFIQPGGLDPQAENTENLPDGYYERLMAGMSEDWINVHVHGQWGEDQSGKTVFGRLFSREKHVSSTELVVNPHRPLMVTQDFGRTPASLISQLDAKGRLAVLAEVHSDGMGLEEYVGVKLVPKLREKRFAVAKPYIVADPAGAHKSQINELSCFDILRQAGFVVVSADTNDVLARIRAVENVLQRHNGTIIDGPNCPTLIRALSFHYKYRRRKTGELEDKPAKTHPWSDLADCFQYGCGAIGGTAELRASAWMNALRPPSGMRHAPVTAAGWT